MSAVVLDAAPPSPPREFVRAFTANRGATVAFAVFALIVLGALLAPLVAPHDPIEQFRDHMLAPPLWQAGGTGGLSAGHRRTRALTCCRRLLFGARVSLLDRSAVAVHAVDAARHRARA